MKATAPSMLASANEYFSKYDLMDIQLLSMSGFGEEDVKEVRKISGIKNVMPSYSTDVLAKLPSEKVYNATKVMAYMKNHTINNLEVLDGRLPQKSGECVVCKQSFLGTKYKVGDKILVHDTAGTTDVTTVLQKLEYKVVGIIDSPMYFSYTYGTCSIGDGNIYSYMLVPEEDFLYARYTEVYVTLDIDRTKATVYSDEYNAALEAVMKKLEPLGVERQKIFNADTNSQLDDSEEMLEQKRKEAYDQLNSAKKELSSAKQQLADSLKQITSGWKEYDVQSEEYKKLIADSEKQIADAKKEMVAYKQKLAEGEKEYKDAEKLLADSRVPLDNGWKEYYAGLAEYEEGMAKLTAAKNELDAARKQINSGWTQYNSGLNQYNNGLKQLEDTKKTYAQDLAQYERDLAAYNKSSWKNPIEAARLAIVKRTLDATYQGIVDGEKQLADAKVTLEDSKKQLDDAEIEYNKGLEEYNKGLEEIAPATKELSEARQKLDDGEKEYDAGYAELMAAKKEIEDGRKQIADGEKQIADSEKQLADGKKEGSQKLKDGKKKLEDGEKEYSSGLDEYNEGMQKYEDAKVETERQLSDGAAQIQNARAMFMEMNADKWYVFSRDDAISNYKNYGQDSSRIDAISALFPVFFLVVAALVCVTTMSRMVDEQRSQMGTYKALGYSVSQILKKYLVYSLTASVIGGILGQIICVMIFPRAIMGAYSMMYSLPTVCIKVPWDMVVVSLAAGIACTALVTVICCRKEVASVTATLMRPKAPKAGKTILLERIPFFWKRLSFSMKITIRNLFRYKIRFLMTVVGITGCTALIVAGFGLQNAISPIVDLQYQKLSTYDVLVSMYTPYNEEQASETSAELISDGILDSVVFQKQIEITAKSDKAKDEKMGNSYAVIPENVKEFEKMYHFYDLDTGKKLKLTDDGAIITGKMAETLKLNVGDTVKFIYEDQDYQVKVSAIAENYVYNYIYITPNTYKKVLKEDLTFNSFIGDTKNEIDPEKILAKNDNFLSAIPVASLCKTMDDTFKSMYLVIAILIISASCLAIVVLYNLTNINISERIREIATTKVLGFNEKEASMYVFRENIIMTIIGLIFGNLFGYILAQKMIDMVEVDVVVFSRVIKYTSYMYATLITIVTTFVVMLLMRKKIRKIDMVEALKSIE